MAEEKPRTVEPELVNDKESDRQRRERSRIAFPYGDLDDAIEVAMALSEHGGLAEMDQLAAWLEHETVDSGTFRMKISTARTFGLIEQNENRVTLTDLGNQIVRPDTELRAKTRAFMQVPLYRSIFDKYKGRLLPGDAALEQDMIDLGVASKQKARARQGFQRSAEQAKLGKDRLVLPAGVSLGPTTPPDGERGRKVEIPAFQTSGEINPLLASLIEDLPVTGEWTREEHDFWLRYFLRTLDKLYKVKDS